MGLEDLRKHILFRDMWTPEDFLKKYYSTSGSIYGTVTDLWKNFGFKAAKRSSKFHNLFFVGGSINPGGGMPMVTLGGIHTGNLVYDMFC
jgi:diapolycopene oxygenase